MKVKPPFVSRLPHEPGVYRMMDAEGTIIYVGKATNLKNRVSSYFLKQNQSPKTQALVSQIAEIDVSVTRTESEALLLESHLIKTLHPKYNVLLRDDKTYPYIHVSGEHPYPGMYPYRSKKKPKGNDYFGPYTSSSAVYETLHTIQILFNIRNCRDSFFSHRTRPCLQYQIKRCSAPCVQLISKADYQQSIKDAVLFLEGKSQRILLALEARMDAAVARLDYEAAALLRDQIKHLRLIQEQQGVSRGEGEADVIAMEVRPGFACVLCVSFRDGHVVHSERFHPTLPSQSFDEGSSPQALAQEVLEAFIAYYYIDNPLKIPPLLLVNHQQLNLTTLTQTLTELRKKRCQIQSHPRGIKAKWLDFAVNNLRLAMVEQQHHQALLDERYAHLAACLHLQTPPKRMECFDISHTQGVETVASCVVFDAQGANKRAYRRFNIEGITKGDDYAAMEQALTRRFKQLQHTKDYPDLLIIDGGKGQVAVARNVLEQLGINGVMLLGIAKGVHRKAGWERLILVNEEREFSLPPDSKALHLLQHIRDEAHRFAITGHRNKRAKRSMESSLQSIEGVGPKKRQALLKRFGGMRELAKAPLEEILKVPGIHHALAERIYQYFHG